LQQGRVTAVARNREKFVQLAEKRVARAIKDLRLIGNLANRNNYDFAPSDADKIVGALEREVKTLKSKFAGGTESREIIFKL
jgi:hypothetical protein